MSTSLGIVLCQYLSGLPTWPTDGPHWRRGCVEQSAVCQSVLSLPALQPTTQFSQRGSCVSSRSLRNSGVRLAACGLPDVARVLLPCHRINVIAHRLRAVAGTHMSAARNQKTRAGRNLSDGSAASRSPLLLNPSQREIAFSCPFLRRAHVRPSCWTVLRHFRCYSPGAIVSELSVTPSHAIQDCRHSAARLRVVPTVCCITTRLLPLTGSILPTRLYRSAFHEPGQLRHLLLTIVCPSR